MQTTEVGYLNSLKLRADGSVQTAYRGVLRSGKAVVWTCDHDHDWRYNAPGSAKACAAKEQRRRTASTPC